MGRSLAGQEGAQRRDFRWEGNERVKAPRRPHMNSWTWVSESGLMIERSLFLEENPRGEKPRGPVGCMINVHRLHQLKILFGYIRIHKIFQLYN